MTKPNRQNNGKVRLFKNISFAEMKDTLFMPNPCRESWKYSTAAGITACAQKTS